ncbi:MAG: DUF481 domain-containing protein [Puniceicoccales bacterium]
MLLGKQLLLGGSLFVGVVCYGQYSAVSAFEGTTSDSAVVSIPTVSGSIDTEDYDWLFLTSGEVLKGEIKEMYDGSLTFDSDVLGDVDVDWDDIKAIRTDKPMSLRLNRRETISGTVKFEGDTIEVTTANGETITVKRDNVVAMVQDHSSELDNWSFEVGAGLNIQRGNTNETSYSANIDITRQTALTRLNMNYLGNYTKTNGATTTSNQLLNASFDYYLDKRIFFRIIDLTYYRDPFQNLAHQGTIGAGIGYQIFDTSDFEWEVIAGPAYQFTKYDSVTAGNSQTVSSPGALIITTYSYDITGDLTLDGNYDYLITEKNNGFISSNMNTTLTYEINDLVDIYTTFVINYIANPTQASDGTTPSSVDTQWIFGVGLSY